MKSSGQTEAGEAAATGDSVRTKEVKPSIGISILVLMLRFLAVVATLGSAVAMGTSSETVRPIFSQFILRAKYNDLPAFKFFVIANSIACAYLFLSLPVCVFNVIKTAKMSRIILISFDTVMLALLTSGASAAAAIVYLAHEGNGRANWSAVCQRFNNFCERISGSLVGSFAAIIMLIVIIISSAVSLSR